MESNRDKEIQKELYKLDKALCCIRASITGSSIIFVNTYSELPRTGHTSTQYIVESGPEIGIYTWDGANYVLISPPDEDKFTENIDYNNPKASITNATYYIRLNSYYPFIINNLKVICESGTCTMDVKINGATVTGMSAISVSGTIASATATALNTVAINDSVSIVITSATLLKNLSVSFSVTRT